MFGESKLVEDLRYENSQLKFSLSMVRLEKDQTIESLLRQIETLTRERDFWKEIACLSLSDLWKLCLESELWKKIHQPKPRARDAKLRAMLAEARKLLNEGGEQ